MRLVRALSAATPSYVIPGYARGRATAGYIRLSAGS